MVSNPGESFGFRDIGLSVRRPAFFGEGDSEKGDLLGLGVFGVGGATVYIGSMSSSV